MPPPQSNVVTLASQGELGAQYCPGDGGPFGIVWCAWDHGQLLNAQQQIHAQRVASRLADAFDGHTNAIPSSGELLASSTK